MDLRLRWISATCHAFSWQIAGYPGINQHVYETLFQVSFSHGFLVLIAGEILQGIALQVHEILHFLKVFVGF